MVFEILECLLLRIAVNLRLSITQVAFIWHHVISAVPTLLGQSTQPFLVELLLSLALKLPGIGLRKEVARLIK